MPLALPERFEPDDFVVDEIPAYPPSGSGGHTFLQVEKRGWTTEALARVLARAAGVGPRDVGYAGRKDRHAVTTQWFSVPGFDPEAALALDLDRVRVLEATPHESKLRTGHLRGNRFTVTLHDVDAGDARAASDRLDRLARDGMPNRFGRQRFGHDGDNAAGGIALLRGETRPRDRREARFLLSALQSAVFNEALHRRALPLGELEVGDVAVVHPSGGLFVVEDLTREAPRAAAFEVSPTGPLFGTRSGRRDPAPEGAPAAREAEAAASLGVDLSAPLTLPRGVRLPGARRALRVRPEEPGVEHEADRLRLRFTLPPGSYATVLLEELSGVDAMAAP
ncbi:MAG: tRNA pseudouridine(13) synthase TruD [Deltaproteobacteria bacterium]|nr:tRNA pseudouridine(13) synthase TruD [Deltaproteobacteria bacterium]